MNLNRTFTLFDAHCALAHWTAFVTVRHTKNDATYWQARLARSLRAGNARLRVTPKLP